MITDHPLQTHPMFETIRHYKFLFYPMCNHSLLLKINLTMYLFANISLSWHARLAIFIISRLISHILSLFQRVLSMMHDLCKRFFLLLLLIGSILSLSLTFAHSLLWVSSSTVFIKSVFFLS